MISAMGVKTARLTNSRGFVIELCVAAVVILASRLSLPMSSTPATVGAIAGVGLFEGRRGFNGRLFAKFVAGWALTIVATALLTMAFTAQGLYSPNKAAMAERATLASYLNATAAQAAAALPAAKAKVCLCLGVCVVALRGASGAMCLLQGSLLAVSPSSHHPIVSRSSYYTLNSNKHRPSSRRSLDSRCPSSASWAPCRRSRRRSARSTRPCGRCRRVLEE